jgi:hypothetical protein
MTNEIIELEAEEIQYPVMSSEPTIVHIGGKETTSPGIDVISEPIIFSSRLEKIVMGKYQGMPTMLAL